MEERNWISDIECDLDEKSIKGIQRKRLIEIFHEIDGKYNCSKYSEIKKIVEKYNAFEDLKRELEKLLINIQN